MEKKFHCNGCQGKIFEHEAVWLELSNTDDRYYIDIPAGHVSQGFFAFEPYCAERELKSTQTKENKAAVLKFNEEKATNLLRGIHAGISWFTEIEAAVVKSALIQYYENEAKIKGGIHG